MDKQKQGQIIKALEEKNVTQPCPRCRNLEFEVLGETKIELHTGPTIIGLPGNRLYLPVFLISCKRCGYIAQHAAAMLGLTG
jgi:predicted nucleic-acid-binding Zn-ribbon protein